MTTSPLLQVRDLRVEFRTGRETVHAVNGASFSVERGEVVAVLGESGSGKSVTATTIMRLLPTPPARVAGGEVLFKGRDILTLPQAEWRDMLGAELALVLQDALTALNPVFSVGWQIAEVFRIHGERDRKRAMRRAIDLLERVGIPGAALRAKDYPHQFSGGMRQRVMIAMAVALHPQLLIADEPTTALDVTVQAQIMELMTTISREEGMAVLLITHDLGVVVDHAKKVCVMYAGRVVESGLVGDVLRQPAHPYTLALMHSAPQAQDKGQRLRPIVGSPPDMARVPSGCPFHPRCTFATDLCRTERPPAKSVAPGRLSECHYAEKVFDAAVLAELLANHGESVLSVRNLSKHYLPRTGFGVGGKKPVIRAVDDVSFELRRGETIGLVGESGCGKSTIARTILRLEEATSGEVLFRGKNIFSMNTAEMKTFRRKVQVIFQDPYASLNPRLTVEDIISEGWTIHHGIVPKAARPDRVRDLLTSVGLRREHAERYPHQFSGGQLQRIGIARAMALEPEVLICDEPVSALDLSIQAQVINLLEEIQDRLEIAYVFIAHDLSIVRHMSDRVAVMYLGRMAELGLERDVYGSPSHPYTKALLSAEPSLKFGEPPRQRILLKGEVPSPANPPSGCRFRTRCWKAQAVCAEMMPELSAQPNSIGHFAACHFPENVPEKTVA